jgi:putative transposase
MSHTYTSAWFHAVFATKGREASIAEPLKLWAYLAGTPRNLHFDSVVVGGTENHVHMLLKLPSDVCIAEAVKKLKSNSSRWLREWDGWHVWQEGYGAFSVSASNRDAVRRYIHNQPEHHGLHSFEEEFRAMLARSGEKFNPSEIFD